LWSRRGRSRNGECGSSSESQKGLRQVAAARRIAAAAAAAAQLFTSRSASGRMVSGRSALSLPLKPLLGCALDQGLSRIMKSRLLQLLPLLIWLLAIVVVVAAAAAAAEVALRRRIGGGRR